MYNETYDDYIRSILGYPPLNLYENNVQDYRNQNMNINYNSTLDMDMSTDRDLESCYPEIYKIVYPMVAKKCDNVRMFVTKDDIENMTDEIYYALEERNETKLNINLTNEVRTKETSKTRIPDKKPEVTIAETSSEKRETRQINRNLRDLIQILIIRELLRRRRRPGERPPMPPRPPMRPPMRPPIRPRGSQFNREFEYDIFEY